MKKPYILVIGILVLSLVISSILGGCAPVGTSKLKVVTSTAAGFHSGAGGRRPG